jgi:hypothetical protein
VMKHVSFFPSIFSIMCSASSYQYFMLFTIIIKIS